MSMHRPEGSRSWPEPTRISIAAAALLVALLAGLLTLPARSAPAGAEVLRTSVAKPQAAQAKTQADEAPLARRTISIGITVADMERALDFYTRVLDFQLESDIEVAGEDWERLQGVFGARMRICTLRLGEERIELTEYLAPTGRPIPVDSRSNDGWFQHIAIITSDMDAAYARLREHRVRHASTGPQTLPAWNLSAGGIKAFYFRDPEDHVLEVLQFPPGKGQERWQSREALFLGIDHTAIVVRDTDASLGFYRDRLGMIVAGEAENYGSEQEHLNNVFGARLRITALRWPGEAERVGPAIELLEYLAPCDGRPYPADTRGNDLWHWQINFACDEPGEAFTSLRGPMLRLVSPGVIEMDGATTFEAGLHLRDPDGHALRFLRAGGEEDTDIRAALP